MFYVSVMCMGQNSTTSKYRIEKQQMWVIVLMHLFTMSLGLHFL
jgi:hypothetical protein